MSVFLFACTEQATNEASNSTSTNASTKVQIPISNDLTEVLSNFPKNWKELTHENGEYVFYNPCDADIPNVHIANDQGKVVLLYSVGKSLSVFEVNSMKKWEEKSSEGETSTYFTVMLRANPELMEVKIDVTNPDRSTWSGGFIGMRVMTFAPENAFDKYPTLHAPCLECFGPKECDIVKQDWGIGMLKPSFKENIKLYNFKGDTEAAQEIQFSNGMVANYDELSAWSAFENYFPDYDICYIRCLKEEDGWYQVLANKTLNRVMWVKKSPHVNFLTWKEYLTATLDVLVLNPEKNRFRTGKGTGAVIDLPCAGGFKVLDVDGQYLKVKQNELTAECVDAKPVTTEGWIQWRDDNKLMIRTAWVM